MKKYYKRLYNLALESRKFQLKINNLIIKKKFKLPIHLAFGHEFISSLVKLNFNKNDQLLLAHRNIHFTSLFSKNAFKNYLKFSNFNNTLEYNVEGSMNYVDKKSNIIYSSSILGNNFSIACGVAKSLKKKNGITICVAGDGAIEEGTFYESLILSKYLKLPLVFLIENNNNSMYTTIKERRSNINVGSLAKSIGINYFYYKKNEIKKNIKKFKYAINRIRKKREPMICEFEVKTLGSRIESGKTIPYHHGGIILKTKDLIIGNPKNDIIYIMKSILKFK